MAKEKSSSYLNQTWYVISFIFVLCLFASISLSTVYYFLSPIQKQAVDFDRDQQMLIAAHVLDPSGNFQLYDQDEWVAANYDKSSRVLKVADKNVVKASLSSLNDYAKGFVRPLLADRKGRIFSFEEKHIDFSEFIEKHQQTHLHHQPLLLFYAILKNTEQARNMSSEEVIRDLSSIQSLVIPVSGFGLWGPIFGYLGIKNDGNTVLGTTWYQQGETPGLGANIAKSQWQKQFYGKRVFLQTSSDETTDFAISPLGLEVIKGCVQSTYGDSPKAASSIDGISGATLTCHGVTEAYASSLAPYRNLLISFTKLNQRDLNGK